MTQGNLRPMVAEDLLSVWRMRNHPEVRRHMLTKHEISIEEHRTWFERESRARDTELLVFTMDRSCCGFVQFKQTEFYGVMDWGFYVSPDAPKGTGKKLGLTALNYVFKKEELHKICGQVLSLNQPSIEFHKALGFIKEGVLREQYFIAPNYQDVVCFGMLRSDWLVRQPRWEINK